MTPSVKWWQWCTRSELLIWTVPLASIFEFFKMVSVSYLLNSFLHIWNTTVNLLWLKERCTGSNTSETGSLSLLVLAFRSAVFFALLCKNYKEKLCSKSHFPVPLSASAKLVYFTVFSQNYNNKIIKYKPQKTDISKLSYP